MLVSPQYARCATLSLSVPFAHRRGRRISAIQMALIRNRPRDPLPEQMKHGRQPVGTFLRSNCLVGRY